MHETESRAEAVAAALRTESFEAQTVNCSVVGVRDSNIGEITSHLPEGWAAEESSSGVIAFEEGSR